MKFPFFLQIRCLAAITAALTLCGFADVSVKDVETAFIEENYGQAKSLAENLLAEETNVPARHELTYYIGLSDLRMGHFAQARGIFTDLLQQDISAKLRDKARLGIFDSYYIAEDYDKALKSIKALKKASPQSEFSSLIYLKLARVHLKLAQWKKAREYLLKITEDYPDSMEVHVAKQLLNEKQYFAVQVGAFMDRQRAEKLTEELQKKGEYAYVVETVDHKNRTFYRVRVGQLVLLDKAQKLKRKLSQEGYPTQIYP